MILIATHHKTGTVWMGRLFQSIAKRLDYPFRRLKDHEPVDSTALRAGHSLAFLFQDHARFDPDLALSAEDRGWHLIRDPRDVLISGANYHGWSHEPWLHQPREKFEGRSYQQQIRPLSFEDAVRFEMDRSTGQAVRDMLSFDRRQGSIRDIAFEDLRLDHQGDMAIGLFRELGFDDHALAICLECYREEHVGAIGDDSLALRQHIQSADCAQWRYLFTAELLDDLERKLPRACERLGYPPSDPALLVDDQPRREAYLARFLANRGATEPALARLETALLNHPSDPNLAAMRELISRSDRTRPAPGA